MAEFFSPQRRSKRAAFTLAEVLITLAIIGIVAALTMPALIAKWQEKAWDTDVMGVVFADGVSGLVIYNPNCEKVDLSHNQCFEMLFDVSGFKKPNQMGKDIRMF